MHFELFPCLFWRQHAGLFLASYFPWPLCFYTRWILKPAVSQELKIKVSSSASVVNNEYYIIITTYTSIFDQLASDRCSRTRVLQVCTSEKERVHDVLMYTYVHARTFMTSIYACCRNDKFQDRWSVLLAFLLKIIQAAGRACMFSNSRFITRSCLNLLHDNIGLQYACEEWI